MKDDRILITNIQRFSLHDGPGIRTTVFLKGCSLHCPWCSNPENIKPHVQKYENNGKTGNFGYYISAENLTEKLLQDHAFYGVYREDRKNIEDLPGGVTFSGGEPLLQMDALVPVCEALHKEKVHQAVETSLFVPDGVLEDALSKIDLFLVDVKILDEERVGTIEGGRLLDYLRNLDRLMRSEKPVVLRVPLIKGYTDGKKNMNAVMELIKKYQQRIDAVELIRGHEFGISKYRALGLKQVKNAEVPTEEMRKYQSMIQELGVRTDLCMI